MAKFELIKSTGGGIATVKAAKEIVTNGSADLRAVNTAKEILRGEQDVPNSLGELKQILTNNVFGLRPDKYIYVSQFDTPVRNYIKFESGSYQKLDKDGNLVNQVYPDVLIDSAIIRISMSKHVVKTAVNGRNGTRKEYVSDGDFEIKITGVISSNHPSIYPEEEVNALHRVLRSPELLSVVSPQLARLGINTMLVEDYDFDQDRGVYNTQKFSIKAVSHEPIDVFLENVERESSRRNSKIGQAIEQANETLQKVRDAVNNVTNDILERGGNQIEGQ